MPRRLKNKLKQLSQKKHITKRLMAITLDVDKYIYKHKPISISQAEMCLEEVTKYKELCLGDARSLQVIEKLTRFMKAIIEENSNQASIDSESLLAPSQNVSNYAVSPVYSLADEEYIYRNQMIEFMNNENVVNEIGDNIASIISAASSKVIIVEQPIDISEATPLVDNQTSFQTMNNIDNIPTPNILKNNIEQERNEDNKGVMIDLNLSGEASENYDFTNSQSILANVIIPDIFMYDNDINNTCAQNMSEIDKEIDNILQHEVANVTIDENGIINNSQSTNVTKPIETFPIQNVFSEISKGNEPTPLNKLKSESTKIKKVNKKGTDKTKKTRGRKPKQMTKCNINENVTKTSKNTPETFIPLRKPIVKKCSTIGNIPNKPPSKGIKINRKITKPKNKIIEDDLSWVENIKYVREINLEEYDPKLNPLLDTFWENCELPDNWNDQEFE